MESLTRGDMQNSVQALCVKVELERAYADVLDRERALLRRAEDAENQLAVVEASQREQQALVQRVQDQARTALQGMQRLVS